MKKLILLIGLLIFSCKEHNSNVSQLTQNPNVIIVFTDDQGYGDLGYHGNPILKTPNLDAFAEASLELTNFHVGTTCSPSRAGLLTGRNANRNNAWHTIAGCSILSANEETMAEVFGNNQYETVMFGKWHLGDNYPYRPIDRGFQHALYHGGGGIGQTPDYWGNDYFNDNYFRNGKPEKFNGYCTDVWFNQAIEFLEERESGEPFFMYLALNAAHSPFNVPDAFAEMYEDAPLSEEQKRFYGMITNIDLNFGRLIEYLKKNKLFENTILIFTTDNGTARGITHLKDKDKVLGYNAGLRGIKGSHYDGGHRVP
ncbi:MAG: sulfatase-like hydrolase/transferase, partial [Eudoraea sp.]|nr:sulfatase-like hydrolase/transferase [Eudoraea sp.]